LILAGVVAVQRSIAERRLEWRTPLAALAGMAAGMLLNPYFPHNLRMFWLQNFVVPWMAVQEKVDLRMAVEFLPPGWRDLLLMHAAVAVPVLVALVVAVARPRRVSRRTVGLLLISLALFVLTLRMQRFVEYSVPLTLFFVASFFSDRLGGFDPGEAWRAGGVRRTRLVVAVALVLGALAAFHVRTYLDTAPRFRAAMPRFEEAGSYLARETAPGEVVFTCDWDDTPELFYFNHHNRYVVFLDPTFLYFHDPAYWRRWRVVADGQAGGRTHELLAEEFRFGVCTQDYERLRWIVERDPRLTLVLDSPGAYLFRVEPDAGGIPLDLFLELNSGPAGTPAR
jgi:hypothetical protein